RRIVAGRVRAGPVGDVLDQCRPAALAGALRRPPRRAVHGKKIVAVDTHPWNTVSGSVLREGTQLTAGETLERRDRPLIVDDVENDRRLVQRGEGHAVVEVRL